MGGMDVHRLAIVSTAISVVFVLLAALFSVGAGD
jgi:hypothetical protein